MRASPFEPKRHLFVCTNRRNPDSPLGGGCGERGAAVYAALKALVAERGETSSVWVTQTGCLGVCPKVGATVARYESAADAAPRDAPRPRIFTEVDAADARTLYDASRIP
jgi:(2Fe-2S) ferredoxin